MRSNMDWFFPHTCKIKKIWSFILAFPFMPNKSISITVDIYFWVSNHYFQSVFDGRTFAIKSDTAFLRGGLICIFSPTCDSNATESPFSDASCPFGHYGSPIFLLGHRSRILVGHWDIFIAFCHCRRNCDFFASSIPTCKFFYETELF